MDALVKYFKQSFDLRTHHGYVLFATLVCGIAMSMGLYPLLRDLHGGPLPLVLLVVLVVISFISGWITGEGAWRILNWYFGKFRGE